MNPGTYSGVDSLLSQAAAAAPSIAAGTSSLDLYSFDIVTNQNATLTGQVQEFIIVTPEPDSWGLAIWGVLEISLVALIRARQAA